MSRLEELIEQYCPDGVEWKALGDYLSYEQPTKYLVASTKYDDSFLTPVLTAGQSFILGYTNEKVGVFQASKDVPVIIFDDFTTSFHWVDFSFKVKSSAMKMLRPTDEKKALFRYLYYCMKNIPYVPGDHTRQWIGIYSQFEIPVPPLPVQEEIVRILDNFTELQAELQAELQKRLQQYNYYRDSLLSFEGRTDVQWKRLEDLGVNLDRKRKPIASGKRVRGDIPYYGASGIVDYVEGYIFDGDYLLVSEDGANLLTRTYPIAFSIHGKTWVNNHAHVIEFKERATRKYVEYYLNSIDLSLWISAGAQPKLTQDSLNKLTIPVPPLADQQKIVSILDRFDTLTTDLTQGLPAEIEKRRQQYEYYRDKLLTFKRKEA